MLGDSLKDINFSKPFQCTIQVIKVVLEIICKIFHFVSVK